MRSCRLRVTPRPIPLIHAEITHADEQAVRSQLHRAPFTDGALLSRWEAAWARLWDRPALAFAQPVEPILALKRLLGWRSGDWVGSDPLLDPAWTEAFAAAWLHLSWRDIDPRTGRGQGGGVTHQRPAWQGGTRRAGLSVHPYGLPTGVPELGVPFWLEEISSIIRPLPGVGWGDVQLLHLSGNRMVAAGDSCLLLTQDTALYRALQARRRQPPSALACALGLSQLAGLEARLDRRLVLAERYRYLRSRALFRLPDAAPASRVWEMFMVEMRQMPERMALQAFLQKAKIYAGSPVWFQTVVDNALPGLERFQERVLALPLYAALTCQEQKRVINRLHRWVERTVK